MRNIYTAGILIMSMLTFISCDKDDSRLEEVSGIQGQKNAEKQIEEENKNQMFKASQMEIDLKSRINFYRAIIGEYKGELEVQGQKSLVEIAIIEGYLPATLSERTRSLEEINYDLNHISLSVQIKRYTSNTNVVIVSCQMDFIKPDMHFGRLSLGTKECRDFYQLNISEDLTTTNADALEEQKSYAKSIYLGQVKESIPLLKGHINPGATPGKFKLLLRRVNDAQ